VASVKDLLRYALMATDPPGHGGLEVARRANHINFHFRPFTVSVVRQRYQTPSANWRPENSKPHFFSRNLTLSANSNWLAEGVGYDEKCFVF